MSTPTTPVAGYREQSEETLAMVNANKIDEEMLLRKLDKLAREPSFDGRWLSIARTHFEQAYMAFNRALMRPQRLDNDAINRAATQIVNSLPGQAEAPTGGN